MKQAMSAGCPPVAPERVVKAHVKKLDSIDGCSAPEMHYKRRPKDTKSKVKLRRTPARHRRVQTKATQTPNSMLPSDDLRAATPISDADMSRFRAASPFANTIRGELYECDNNGAVTHMDMVITDSCLDPRSYGWYRCGGGDTCNTVMFASALARNERPSLCSRCVDRIVPEASSSLTTGDAHTIEETGRWPDMTSQMVERYESPTVSRTSRRGNRAMVSRAASIAALAPAVLFCCMINEVAGAGIDATDYETAAQGTLLSEGPYHIYW